MSKRILIFSIAYEPLIGGAELAVRNITDRLSNYTFDLVTCRFDRRHKAFEKIGNINVYRVGFDISRWRIGRFLYPLFAFRLAKKLHRQNPYQIVWSIMAAYAGAAALLFLRRFPKIKFLLTLQEGDPISHIHGRVRGFRKAWQTVFRRADYIQAISRFLADWARQEGAVCPIEIVPNGVETKNFQFSMSNFQSNPNDQIFKIITVSRLVHKNAVDILIRAAAILKTHIPHSTFHIQIAGSGPEESKLKQLVKDLKIEDQVHFLGSITQDELPQYLSEADIFVRPSRSEGLGTAFLEAMAAGLPVIGTAVGGIPDFLVDYNAKTAKEDAKNANGMFCKPEDPEDLADKINQLMEDAELRIQLGQTGRRLMEEKYSWDRVARQMQAIFAKLC